MTADRAPARRLPGRDLWLAAAVALGLALLLRGAVVEPFRVPTGSMAPTLLPGDHLLVSRLAYGVRLPFSGVVLLALPPPRRGDVLVFRDPADPSRHLVKRVVGLPGEVVELREQVLLVDGVPQPRLELGELRYLEPDDGGGPGRTETCRRWRELLTLGPVGAPGQGPAPGAPPAGPPMGPGPTPAGPEVDAAEAAARWAAGQARLAAGEAVGHDLLQCRRVRAGRREGPFGPVRPGHLFVLGDNRDRSADSRAGWEVPLADVVGRGALLGWSWGPGGWWPWGAEGVRIERLFKPVE